MCSWYVCVRRYLKWDDAPCDLNSAGDIRALCEVDMRWPTSQQTSHRDLIRPDPHSPPPPGYCIATVVQNLYGRFWGPWGALKMRELDRAMAYLDAALIGHSLHRVHRLVVIDERPTRTALRDSPKSGAAKTFAHTSISDDSDIGRRGQDSKLHAWHS